MSHQLTNILETEWLQGKSAGACDRHDLNYVAPYCLEAQVGLPEPVGAWDTHPAVDDDYMLRVAVQP